MATIGFAMRSGLLSWQGRRLRAARLEDARAQIGAAAARAVGRDHDHAAAERLFQLRQHPEGLTAAELAERSLEDKAAVSRAVARLEELGLVELPEEGGKRRYRAKLRLTEAGRAAAERMTGKIRQAVQRGGRGLTDGQREDFYRALGVIARNLEQICSTEEPI